MGDYAVMDVSRYAGDDGGAARTQITASVTANVKGAYTTIFASTPVDADGIMMDILHDNDASSHLTDFAVGAAGSEQDIIPNVFTADNGMTFRELQTLYFPISIPAGTRLSARTESTIGSSGVFPKTRILRGGFPTPGRFSRVTDYGTVVATSTATTVTPGNAVKGAWAQLVASTTRPIRYAVLITQVTAAPTGNDDEFVDIGIGAAGSEQVIVPDIYIGLFNGTPAGLTHMETFLPLYIPAGTRIAVRALSVQAAADPFVCAIYGVD